MQMRRQGEGWLFNIPDLLNLKTDGQQWPEGSLSLLYIPPSAKYGGNPHLRIRANDIELARLSSIVPTFSFLTNDIVKAWQEREPSGLIRDLPLISPRPPGKPRTGCFLAGCQLESTGGITVGISFQRRIARRAGTRHSAFCP